MLQIQQDIYQYVSFFVDGQTRPEMTKFPFFVVLSDYSARSHADFPLILSIFRIWPPRRPVHAHACLLTDQDPI